MARHAKLFFRSSPQGLVLCLDKKDQLERSGCMKAFKKQMNTLNKIKADLILFVTPMGNL
ncbi:hypothetical protein BCY91_12345 [Pelobium manganitolerans]|uniref:Uncharacterized protein n=1 Tax=Pelobium manganitolerans TaxID=1842495 RepID=A0A419S1S1_9SPHI|nr:hypothetical protein BCY91_12345 [Pelobium manganitolerans]